LLPASIVYVFSITSGLARISDLGENPMNQAKVANEKKLPHVVFVLFAIMTKWLNQLIQRLRGL